jgi:Mn2+/Fe2+ NRAMP family transporter
MKTRNGKRTLQPWQRADHNLAVATIALMAFLLIAGTTAWLLDQKPGTADAAPANAHSRSVNK